MWEMPFDVSLLDKSEGVVINCPTEELEREIASILDELGFHYPDGGKLSNISCWGGYEEDFCYYVAYGSVKRGPKKGTEESPWKSYTKCTFYGVETPDFSAATDDELCSLLGV